MDKKIVLFAAGRRAPYYIEKIISYGLEIDFIVDNNTFLTGQKVKGIVIKPPTEILPEHMILITCKEKNEITLQLAEMKLLSQILEERELFLLLVDKIRKRLGEFFFHLNHFHTVIFELVDRHGYFHQWGGTEQWTYNVERGLREQGYSTVLFANQLNECRVLEESPTVFFKNTYTIFDLAIKLIKYLPCSVIDNTSQDLLQAAIAVKALFPEQIKIITVLHNDLQYVYNNAIIYQDQINQYICVSKKIADTLHRKYLVETNKINFKESMIFNNWNGTKIYHSDRSTPIRIGYGCRLVKQQKQSHLLPLVIKQLEELGSHYQMEIAGQGECFEFLKAWIEKEGLEKKVRLLGRLNRDEMDEFWKRQDVYLNISLYEGTSLAMLEAMSYGCVPVVTQVSGVDEFVRHRVNGCVIATDDPEKAADEILYLDENRVLLEPYGCICRKLVKEKCNPEDHIAFMEKILFGWRREVHDKDVNSCSNL